MKKNRPEWINYIAEVSHEKSEQAQDQSDSEHT